MKKYVPTILLIIALFIIGCTQDNAENTQSNAMTDTMSDTGEAMNDKMTDTMSDTDAMSDTMTDIMSDTEAMSDTITDTMSDAGEAMNDKMTDTMSDTDAMSDTMTETMSDTHPVKEFQMTAKRYEFVPDTITVNKGDKVILKITATDVTHGFRLSEYGIEELLTPNREVIIEFIADKTGEFEFYCQIYCGSGHSQMRGKLIVS